MWILIRGFHVEVESRAFVTFTGSVLSHWLRCLRDTWIKIRTRELEAFREHIYAVDNNNKSMHMLSPPSVLTLTYGPHVADIPAVFMRWWYSGEHSCLPSSWPGFDSRPSQNMTFFKFYSCLPPELTTALTTSSCRKMSDETVCPAWTV